MHAGVRPRTGMMQPGSRGWPSYHSRGVRPRRDAHMPNRWTIAAAAVVMQVALGSVYAWSVFRIPLTQAYGWTISEVTVAFTLAIFVLGLAAFAGGLWMQRAGPRTVALAAGVLYGLGVFLASRVDGRLWWLYGSYGLIAGAG